MDKGSEDRRICEEFVQLLERSQQLFAGLRDIPMFGKQWEPYFQRTFDIYTRLWKFQQQHRPVLENKERYGMERWEIGEIASKIGQLYYHYYLRTSETHYLEESFVFYEAIRARAYFKGVSKLSKPSIMVKQLRYFARFIVVCLLLGRHTIVDELVSELTTLVEEYIMLKPNDAQEWQLVVQEITLFLQADYPLRIKDSPNFVPYRRFPPQLLLSQPIASRLYLQNALLISNHQHQVKFSELTLDMFRINVSLEKELATLDKEMLSMSDFRPNPKKYLIYRPTSLQLLLYLASATKELKENGVMLFYISADGEKPQIPPLPMDLANSKYLPYSHGGLKLNSKEDETRDRSSSIGSNGPSSNDSPRGSLGSGPLDLYSSRDCLYPEDMMPFLRNPMVIIADSDNASSFLHIPNTFGVPFMVLCSPRAQPPELLEASQAGNLFTFFLHDPLSAFCFVVAKTVFPLDVHKKCTECVNNLFLDLASDLQSSSELPVNCARLIQDEFILMFFMRFLFCHTMFSTNVLFLPQPRQYLPACHPKLPKALLLHPRVVAGIQQLAGILGVSHRFKYPASVDLLVSKDNSK
jgi:hypothetical protein